MKSPTELSEAFRSQGRKLTPQRQAIFDALDGNPSHPSAESVYDMVRVHMPSISLRTVYQTLNDLTEMGEISQVDLGLGSARFDPNNEPHHHLVCSGCATVFDVAVEVDSPLPDLEVPAGLGDGFVVDSTDIIFRGMCARCAAGQQPTDLGPVP
jgi:Fe2+ or Zn2+ uptake regulation protein